MFTFPEIRCLDDVLDVIDGREEFYLNKKDDYYVVNYSHTLKETWDYNDKNIDILRECRGIIFDENKRIMSRPYHKFFNLNENEKYKFENVNFNNPHIILRKLDGSMIRPIVSNNKMRLASKAGITECSMQAEDFIRDKKEYHLFMELVFNEGLTPIFEWCSLKNQIVIEYKEDDLVLTAIRENISGNYLLYEIMKYFSEPFNIPLVNCINYDNNENTKNVIEKVKDWENDEGIVVRFDDGDMVKIKSNDYVLKHKVKDQINLEKNVIKIIIENKIDDIVAIIDENSKNRLIDFNDEVWKGVSNLCDLLDELYLNNGKDIESQKDFAINFVKTQDPKYHHYLFDMRKGISSKETVIKNILKNVSTGSKVENIRWIWNNKEWKSFIE